MAQKMSYQPKTYRTDGGDRQVIEDGGELEVKSGGKFTAGGTQASHIVDAGAALKTDYAKTDIDDAGTIDGTELAAVLNLITTAYNDLATKYNALLVAAEGVGILASS
jgi:hypothetical protein